jgi:TRAP-type C4-dicarboxylate transport system permease small subunit
MNATVERLLSRIEHVTDTLAVIAMFASMIVVAADVFFRYVLASPQTWVTDVLVLYLLPAIFFMGLPGSYTRGSHVAVDIICNYVSARVRLWLSILARLLAFLVFLAFAYYGIFRLLEAVRLGEIQPGVLVNWPLWPSVMLVPLGATLAMLRAAERFVTEASALGGNEATILEHIGHTPQEEVMPE